MGTNAAGDRRAAKLKGKRGKCKMGDGKFPHFMRLPHIGLVCAMALSAAGCARESAQLAQVRRELSVPRNVPIRDLGVLELAADKPKWVHLGAGRDLSITASVISNDLYQMHVVYTSTNSAFFGHLTRSRTEDSTFQLRPGMKCAPTFDEDSADRLAVVIRPKIVTPGGN